MSIKNYCPNCGNELESDDDFCSECGYKLTVFEDDFINDVPKSNGFFDNLTMKVSFPIILFSFIITAIFIFIGSLIWGLFLSKQTISIYTYFILTFISASFFGGMFIGLVGCKDKTYILPNFVIYIGTIIAILLGGGSLMFTSFWSVVSLSSNLLGSSSNYNDYANSYYDGISNSANDYSSSTSNIESSFVSNLGFNLFILIIGIPIANYLGITVGYYLRENI